MVEPGPRTPRIIFVALGLMVFGAAAPFVGSFIQDLSPDGANMMLGAFFVWSVAGLGALSLGVACTIFGARATPRSGWTRVAIAVAAMLVIAVISLIALLFL